MELSPFGIVLRHLREKQRFSLRDLAEFAKIDHAYIYRLETGEKESPSEDVINRLIKVLKPSKRDAEMLFFLARNLDTDPELIEYALNNQTVQFDEFASAAGVRFRGSARPSPKILIDRIRKVIKGK